MDRLIRYTTTLLALLGLAFIPSMLNAQGCVAVRGMGCASGMAQGARAAGPVMEGDILISAGYRWFRSYRHFRGADEETYRVAQGTEVINLFHGLDFGVTYGIDRRFFATLFVPVTINDRSSMYEHYGNAVTVNPDRKRFETQSAGLGDIRLSVSAWLLDPARATKGNVALGLGVKAPTGRYDVMDDFHKLDAEGNDYLSRRPVDQSIQLGDGGWGGTLEMQAYASLLPRLSAFVNGFYLSNPRNHNGILRSPTNDPADPFSYFSVADQYSARTGFFYNATGRLAFSLAGRVDGVPSTDLIGESEGFRRPGYAVSLEPGFSFQWGELVLNAAVPVALYRNRIRSAQDKIRNTHGDAAFADYLINVSAAWAIPTRPMKVHLPPTE